MSKNISLVALFFFAWFSFVSGFEPEQNLFETCIYNQQLTLNVNNEPLLLPLTGIGSLSPDISGHIKAGKGLGVLGIASWSFGKALEVIGLSIIFTGHTYDDLLGATFLITGITFDLYGVIPSCIGESIVINAIADSGVELSDKGFKIKSRGKRMYGLHWGLMGTGAILTGIAFASSTPILLYMGIAAGGAAELLRGVIAIMPLVRVRKVNRLINARVSPAFNGKGGMGVALICDF